MPLFKDKNGQNIPLNDFSNLGFPMSDSIFLFITISHLFFKSAMSRDSAFQCPSQLNKLIDKAISIQAFKGFKKQ